MSRKNVAAKGTIDIHVHAAPSLFPRWGDADALAEAYREAGMRGFVLKSHHGSSVEIAAAAQSRHRDLAIAGGLVLNHFVGGLNPFAVEAAVALGARVVWLPTIHAAFHGRAVGPIGGFTFQQRVGAPRAVTGLSLLDEEGKLTREIEAIAEVLDGSGVVLATGHCSPEEIVALHRHLRSNERSVDLLINHVRFFAPALSADLLTALADPRTFFEVCFFTTCEIAGAATIEAVAAMMMAHAELGWVVASDAGQAKNPAPPSCLEGFCRDLVAAGVPRALIEDASVARPRRLLGL